MEPGRLVILFRGVARNLPHPRVQASLVHVGTHCVARSGASSGREVPGYFHHVVLRAIIAVHAKGICRSLQLLFLFPSTAYCSFWFIALAGGAFLHSGVLVGLRSTDFFENMAGEDGLAIMSLGIAETFSNVTFEANTFHCPPGEYGHDVDQFDDEVNMTHASTSGEISVTALGPQSGGQ